VWIVALGRAPLERFTPLRRLLAAGVLLAACSVACLQAPARLSRYDNLRFIYLERAPLLSHVVRLAAVLSPAAELPALDAAAPTRAGGPTVDLSRHDLLLISIDALRADHVGAYGYPRATTPEIDGLAAEGVVFEAAYTATPHTSYAVTSLMTGKYMRPLLLQGVGAGSATWADALKRYGYRTAAFYPPALFFVDRPRFERFESTGLGFEYRKVEFASAAQRAEQVEGYLKDLPTDKHLFMWVHLFEPHEPYEAHDAHRFGERNIDRYDSEIASADAGVGRIVRAVRARRPETVVIVTADHGEEFGDHGGRYHGTTVYDEQVRVPLVVHAPGLLAPRRVASPVGLVDLVPTVFTGLGIPVSPRVRGRDLGPLLMASSDERGFAFSETDDQTLLAQGSLRLVCARRVGACRLFDLSTDPSQLRDASAHHAQAFSEMKRGLAGFVSSLGRYETGGEDRSWPQALRRGIAGDSEAAGDVASLLDDADVEVRRKAAEVLFELRVDTVSRHLRRALQSDEDETVRRWSALALTRMEQGAPLTFDLLEQGDKPFARLAALALAEAGDDRGEDVLLAWWRAAFPADPDAAAETLDFQRAKEIAAAFGRIKSEHAVGVLARGLRNVRLRVFVARALAAIGDEAARPALGKALAEERYQDARVAIARALVALDGGVELRRPLVRFLGVPDPLPGGLEIALEADVLRFVGGPKKRELSRLKEFATSGVTVGMVIPEGGNGTGLRVLLRARSSDGREGEIRFGLSAAPRVSDRDRAQPVPKAVPALDPKLVVTLRVPPGNSPVDLVATLPAAVSERVKPTEHGDFVVYATQNVELRACAVVPLADELPPPPPEPWSPGD
jgi:arylsulfatase A-like enzyme